MGEGPLIVYTVVIFVLACITYGIAVPSGLFVPCILMGCAYGRLAGELMHKWTHHNVGYWGEINPGTYAVMGAASQLGGVARMTISLAVILMETTQDLELLIPIMMCLMVSKWIGDLFNISLYDLHIELKCMPFVESKPPRKLVFHMAEEVMSTPCVTLRARERCDRVLAVLQQTTHNGFPVVTADGRQRFIGMVLRNQLAVILRAHLQLRASGALSAYTTAAAAAGNGGGGDPGERRHRMSVLEGGGGRAGARPEWLGLTLADFSTSVQSKRVPVVDLHLPAPSPGANGGGDDPGAALIDLRPFMNPAVITVQRLCSVSRVYSLFRSLGLRHLAVVDRDNTVKGIITRKELMSTFEKDLF